MSNASRKSIVSILQHIENPLFKTQYLHIFNTLEKGTGSIPEGIFKRYKTISYLGVWTRHLEAEIDAMFQKYRSTMAQEALLLKSQLFEKKRQLMALQREKERHSLAALMELRHIQNATAYKLFSTEKQNEKSHSKETFVNASIFERNFYDAIIYHPHGEECQFHSSDLLSNVRAYSASGCAGSSSAYAIEPLLLEQFFRMDKDQVIDESCARASLYDYVRDFDFSCLPEDYASALVGADTELMLKRTWCHALNVLTAVRDCIPPDEVLTVGGAPGVAPQPPKDASGQRSLSLGSEKTSPNSSRLSTGSTAAATPRYASSRVSMISAGGTPSSSLLQSSPVVQHPGNPIGRNPISVLDNMERDLMRCVAIFDKYISQALEQQGSSVQAPRKPAVSRASDVIGDGSLPQTVYLEPSLKLDIDKLIGEAPAGSDQGGDSPFSTDSNDNRHEMRSDDGLVDKILNNLHSRSSSPHSAAYSSIHDVKVSSGELNGSFGESSSSTSGVRVARVSKRKSIYDSVTKKRMIQATLHTEAPFLKKEENDGSLIRLKTSKPPSAAPASEAAPTLKQPLAPEGDQKVAPSRRGLVTEHSESNKTEEQENPKQEASTTDQTPYCFCHNTEGSNDDMMVCCENATCKYAKEGWFHIACLGLLFPNDSIDIMNAMEDAVFYCPGCYVFEQHNPISLWADALPVPSVHRAALIKNTVALWKRVYGEDLEHPARKSIKGRK